MRGYHKTNLANTILLPVTLQILWLAVLPWAFVASYGWYTVLIAALVCYGVMGVEEAAVEVEQPFGGDANDLPLDHMAKDTFDQLFHFICHVGYDKEGRSVSVKQRASDDIV